MPYTPLEWKDGPEGGTPISAANLNRMEQGIKDAHDLAGEGLALADPARRFQVSGCVGGAGIELPSGADSIRQNFLVVIPAGAQLRLKRVRWRLGAPDLVLKVRHLVLPPQLPGYQSSQSIGEDEPDVLIVDNSEGMTTTVTVAILISNVGDAPRQIPAEAGWWIDLAIEES